MTTRRAGRDFCEHRRAFGVYFEGEFVVYSDVDMIAGGDGLGGVGVGVEQILG